MIERNNVLEFIEENSKTDQDGDKVISTKKVQWLLRYYFHYPERCTYEDRLRMSKDSDENITVRRINPDKTSDCVIDVSKEIIFDKTHIDYEIENYILTESIRDIATLIGLKLIDDKQVSINVKTQDNPEYEFDTLTKAIVEGHFEFNAYEPYMSTVDDSRFYKYYIIAHNLLEEKEN